MENDDRLQPGDLIKFNDDDRVSDVARNQIFIVIHTNDDNQNVKLLFGYDTLGAKRIASFKEYDHKDIYVKVKHET